MFEKTSNKQKIYKDVFKCPPLEALMSKTIKNVLLVRYFILKKES